jgi:hypothetical protein
MRSTFTQIGIFGMKIYHLATLVNATQNDRKAIQEHRFHTMYIVMFVECGLLPGLPDFS